MLDTKSLPNLTIFRHRWFWLKEKIIINWRKKESTDHTLGQKIQTLVNLN